MTLQTQVCALRDTLATSRVRQFSDFALNCRPTSETYLELVLVLCISQYVASDNKTVYCSFMTALLLLLHIGFNKIKIPVIINRLHVH